MSIGMDGVVWLEMNYSDKTTEYINVNNIISMIDLTRKQCEGFGMPYPSVQVSMVGTPEDRRIGNESAKTFKNSINNAIKKHYDDIVERALLGSKA